MIINKDSKKDRLIVLSRVWFENKYKFWYALLEVCQITKLSFGKVHADRLVSC